MFARWFGSILQKVVSFHAYVGALMLVLYMIVTLSTTAWSFVLSLQQFLFEGKELVDQLSTQAEVLHGLALSFVFYKAFRVMVAFAESGHLSLKYTLEIAIIAPIVEIVFNASALSIELVAVFGIFAILTSVTYLFFYPVIRQVDKDYQKMVQCD